jgi:hypothetical protein
MWYRLQSVPIEYEGKCTCIWNVMKESMPKEVIKIIDGYCHRGEHIDLEIMKELKEDDAPRLMVLNKRMTSEVKRWIFEGNLFGESYVSMSSRDRKVWIKDPASRIVLTSEGSSIQVKIDTTYVPVNHTLLTNGCDDLSWGYHWVTPFSLKRRHKLRPFVHMDLMQDATSGCMSTFDAVCDVAHNAISRWFHCDPEFDRASLDIGSDGCSGASDDTDADNDADAF